MSWVQAITGLLGALGTFWGAVSYHQGRGHRRRLEALEEQHRDAGGRFPVEGLDGHA